MSELSKKNFKRASGLVKLSSLAKYKDSVKDIHKTLGEDGYELAEVNAFLTVLRNEAVTELLVPKGGV